MSVWLTILAAAVMAIASLAGFALAIVTLPGTWFILAVAVVCQFVFPEAPFSWWTIGVCAGVALLGEIAEIAASAAGAKATGGGRAGAWGSVVGAIAGAVIGSIFLLPIVGTLIGAVGGAGLGALIAERGVAGKTWTESAKVGSGAAAGRLVAVLIKAAIAAGIGVTLTVAVLV